VKILVPFHHSAIERCITGPLLPSRLSICPICIVSARKQTFQLCNVRFKRGSIVKSVYVIVVVVVILHHQQSDNFCKIQKDNAKWTWAIIYVWRFIALLSSGAPCVCVYYTTLRARGACPLQGYWLLSLFTWPTVTSILFIRGSGWNWTAGLVTAGCFAVWLRLWQPWHTLRTSLTCTDIAWHSRSITISVNSQFRYFAGLQQPWPLAWSNHYATTHTDCEMLSEKNNRLSMNTGYKLSPKSEKWNTVSGAPTGALPMKKRADKGLHIAACHHIILVTLVLCILHSPD